MNLETCKLVWNIPSNSTIDLFDLRSSKNTQRRTLHPLDYYFPHKDEYDKEKGDDKDN